MHLNQIRQKREGEGGRSLDRERGGFVKRILFDTSVYGYLLLENEFAILLARYIPDSILVCGTEIVRKELRDTPKDAKIEGRSTRIMLLTLYDFLVRKDKHTFRTTSLVELVAEAYFEAYRKEGGSLSKKSVIDDFKIVAAAALHSADVVVSADTDTLLSDNAIVAYKEVNEKFQLRDPELVPYHKFRESFRRFLNDA